MPRSSETSSLAFWAEADPELGFLDVEVIHVPVMMALNDCDDGYGEAFAFLGWGLGCTIPREKISPFDRLL